MKYIAIFVIGKLRNYFFEQMRNFRKYFENIFIEKGYKPVFFNVIEFPDNMCNNFDKKHNTYLYCNNFSEYGKFIKTEKCKKEFNKCMKYNNRDILNTGSLSQYSKIILAFDMLYDYEINNNIVFDNIIKIRTDSIYEIKNIEKIVEDNNNIVLNDVFWFIKRDSFDNFFTTYSSLLEITKNCKTKAEISDYLSSLPKSLYLINFDEKDIVGNGHKNFTNNKINVNINNYIIRMTKNNTLSCSNLSPFLQQFGNIEKHHPKKAGIVYI